MDTEDEITPTASKKRYPRHLHTRPSSIYARTRRVSSFDPPVGIFGSSPPAWTRMGPEKRGKKVKTVKKRQIEVAHFCRNKSNLIGLFFLSFDPFG